MFYSLLTVIYRQAGLIIKLVILFTFSRNSNILFDLQRGWVSCKCPYICMEIKWYSSLDRVILVWMMATIRLLTREGHFWTDKSTSVANTRFALACAALHMCQICVAEIFKNTKLLLHWPVQFLENESKKDRGQMPPVFCKIISIYLLSRMIWQSSIFLVFYGGINNFGHYSAHPGKACNHHPLCPGQ